MDIFVAVQCGGVFLLGLVFGSFATALTARIPYGKSVFSASDRSECPHCGHKLGVWDLTPFFSWMLLRGRCRYCDTPIGALYPVIELSTAIMCVLSFMALSGQGAAGYILIAASPIITSLIFIDFQHKILPNILVGILFVFGVVFTADAILQAPQNILSIMSDAIAGAVLFLAVSLFMKFGVEFVLKKPALGMGDVKFFAVAGLWLGVQNLAIFCILAGLLGVFIGAAWRFIKKDPVFPFGPALILSFLLLLWLDGFPDLQKTLDFI